MKKPSKQLETFKKDLIDLLEGGFRDGSETEVFYDMLHNIGLLKEEKLDLAELRLLNTAFKELRYALKVFKPYRGIPKAAVFGSARTAVSHSCFKLASDFGKKLAKQGWMIITGGASGIMEAAMVGAGTDKSFGLNIMLPFEQDANSIIKGDQKLVFFKYFFTRKLMFLKESEATVLFPGGFGTFDEGFESFTLVQTGKAKPRPLVLIDPIGSHFWSTTLELFEKNMEAEGWISVGDLQLMRHFHDADEAVHELTHFYSNYHSSRFLREKYLIRLNKPLTAKNMTVLNVQFKDLVSEGKFEKLDLEEDDNKDPKLERLVFHFNRSGYSRLRLLIDFLNAL